MISAPPSNTATSTTAAPAGARSASRGAPTSAPMYPPASTTSSAPSESFSGPKSTWSSPSADSDTIDQPITNCTGLAVRPVRRNATPRATSTSGSAYRP